MCVLYRLCTVGPKELKFSTEVGGGVDGGGEVEPSGVDVVGVEVCHGDLLTAADH